MPAGGTQTPDQDGSLCRTPSPPSPQEGPGRPPSQLHASLWVLHTKTVQLTRVRLTGEAPAQGEHRCLRLPEPQVPAGFRGRGNWGHAGRQGTGEAGLLPSAQAQPGAEPGQPRISGVRDTMFPATPPAAAFPSWPASEGRGHPLPRETVYSP